MIVNKVKLTNFRNISEMSFSPAANVNIICGDNAQGKTNLIEALWLFTGAKSFRGAKENEFIRMGSPFAALSLEFTGEERGQTAGLKFYEQKKKEVLLNGAQKESSAALAGRFCAVVFAPTHLGIVAEGPAERRRFLDLAIGQIRPMYIKLLGDYQKALAQRNSLLKDIPYHSELQDTVELWDDRLAQLGASVMQLRLRYLKKLGEEAKAIYAGLAGEDEPFTLVYQPSVAAQAEVPSKQELYEAILKALRESLGEDIRAGYTTRGVHRDDFEVTVGGLSAKAYGSQGQKRSAVLSLKLGESNILKDSLGENPVILLDDVMSELDAKRQEYILNHVKDKQVFITCCDSNVCSALKDGAVFQIEAGRIV
ncbi:DNA replication/repair protein RecF [Acetanaerobacterium elongatum]|uniref:DNA replication and repair protein RecF n=1 Tax=Acetanaerobacterium elongatum TaxID=258515 RepID=A0A1H0DDH7_9FIRM|nr:DNA replication/repair protein RecF [Acetanaerobacterium elongatum]SDN68056.1 DNA replication and repair protein RecF [Acetanaerobacterium elongatum]